MEGTSKTENSKVNLASMWESHKKQEARFGILILALHCYSGDKNIEHWLLLNHLFQRNQEDDGWKEPQGKEKLL